MIDREPAVTSTTLARGNPYRVMAVVFVAAVVFRVAMYWSHVFGLVYETHDSWEYRDLALSMLRYGVFGLDGVPKMNRQPGYPGFLALVFSLFGSSSLSVRAVQVALDALTCVMVVHMAIALRLAKVSVIIVAGLVVTCLYTAAYSMMLMTETLYTFLVVASVWVLLTSSRESESYFDTTTPRLLLSGAALGIGVLVRPALAPSVAIFGALVFAAGLWRTRLTWSRRAVVQASTFGLVIAVIAASWMLRNYVVFYQEFVAGNDQVTLLGYKTDIPTYRHWYTKQMIAYLSSNEEPFIMIRPFRPPELARYVYPDERADLERAFSRLEREILAGPDPITQPTLDAFAEVAAKRYRAAPRLHVTAPASRTLKLWIAPRISALWEDTSGLNSSMAMIAGFTAYNLLYVVPGMIGVVWGLRQRSRLAFLFVLAMIIGHSWMYTFFLPMPQSRYAIPLFPLLSLAIGALVHETIVRFAARRGTTAGHHAAALP